MGVARRATARELLADDSRRFGARDGGLAHAEHLVYAFAAARSVCCCVHARMAGDNGGTKRLHSRHELQHHEHYSYSVTACIRMHVEGRSDRIIINVQQAR